MVKEIACFEDSSGKLHKSAADAHRAELAIWLASDGAINEASAKALADRMCANAPMLIAALGAISRPTSGKGKPMAVVA